MTRLTIIIALMTTACATTTDEVIDEILPEVDTPMVELTARFDIADNYTTEEPVTVCWDDGHTAYCTDTFLGPPVTFTVPGNRDGWLFVDTGDLVANTAIPLQLEEAPVTIERRLDTWADLDAVYDEIGQDPDPERGALRVDVTLGAAVGNPHASAWVHIDDAIPNPFVVDRVSDLFGGEGTGPLPYLPEADHVDVSYFVGLDPDAGPYTVTAAVQGATAGQHDCEARADIAVFADTITRVHLRCE